MQYLVNFIVMVSKAFKKYGFRTWVWVLQAYFLLWWVQARLNWSSISWVNSKVEFSSEPISADQPFEVNEPSIMVLHEAVRLAERLHFIRANCLPKSIALMMLLRRHNEVARVVIGIAKDNERLASHAWVEVKQGETWGIVGEAEALTETFQKI